MNQNKQKIAIIGAGYVGTGMQKLFPDAVMIDPPRGLRDYEAARDADLAIVCVPTPMGADGSCDISIVKSAVLQLMDVDARLVLIKSTVPPHTTSRLNATILQKRQHLCTLDGTMRPQLVFSPEYMGESKYWTPAEFPQPTDPKSHGFMVLGGNHTACSIVADIVLPVLGPATRFRFMTSTEAELVKYAENCFFALKVTFANELRRMCDVAFANYHMVREGWLDDPRVGPMHSAAFRRARGFDGKCLPKDLNALAAWCRTNGCPSTLLEAVLSANEEFSGPTGATA